MQELPCSEIVFFCIFFYFLSDYLLRVGFFIYRLTPAVAFRLGFISSIHNPNCEELYGDSCTSELSVVEDQHMGDENKENSSALTQPEPSTSSAHNIPVSSSFPQGLHCEHITNNHSEFCVDPAVDTGKVNGTTVESAEHTIKSASWVSKR